MTQEEAVKYWLNPAERNRKSAKSMVQSGHNDWALFVWHLALEKLIKGVLAQENQNIPHIHHLTKLAQQTSIHFTEKQLDQLDEITTYNIEARYEEYKYQLYKKATAKYTKKWSSICERLYQWIKNNQQ